MSDTIAATSPTNNISTATTDFQPVMLVYILYFVGFFLPITAVAGVIIAHLKSSEADPATQSHYSYQIRTFWLGLILVVIGAALAFVVVGWFVLVGWAIWTLIRCIKGFLAAQAKKAIA